MRKGQQMKHVKGAPEGKRHCEVYMIPFVVLYDPFRSTQNHDWRLKIIINRHPRF